MKNLFIKNIWIFALGINFCFFLNTNHNYAQRISPKDIVNVTASASGNGEIKVKLALEIKEGWHINSDKPFDDYLTPTSIALKDSTMFNYIKTIYPPAEIVKLEFFQSDLSLFQDVSIIELVLKPIDSFLGKEFIIEGEISYQPCNDQTCLFPTRKPFLASYKPE